MKQPDFRMFYCKALKKTGKPIIVKDMATGKVTFRKSINMKNVNIKMNFMNGKKNERGATTVLEVFKL